MKSELAKRHAELIEEWGRLNREYTEVMLDPNIRKWRGMPEGRQPHVVWSALYRTVIELDMIALRFCGAEVGDIVKLIGKRYDGALAKIEGIEIASRHGNRFTPLGKKSRIRVTPPASRHPVLISGDLWELARKDSNISKAADAVADDER